MKKTIVSIIIILFVGIIGWQVYQKIMASESASGSGKRGRRSRVTAVAIEAESVSKIMIRDISSFTGTLYPKSQFNIAPKIQGRIERLMVDISDKVSNGQLIAILDEDEYLQQVDQARAKMEVANAKLEESRSNLNTTKREFDRVKALREKGIASESDLDSATAKFEAGNSMLKVALAQVALEEATLKVAQVRLSYTQIHALWEGGSDTPRVVGERFVDEGAMVSSRDPIVSIIDIDTLIAVIHVIERDYSKIERGQEVEIINDAYPDRSFTGKVVRIAPILVESSRQARIEIEIPNPKAILKPGMFVEANIEFARKDNAVVVPLKALTKSNDQPGIFLVDESEQKARFVSITTGIINEHWVEVLNPALSGKVVTLGMDKLEDGSDIILPESKSNVPSKGRTSGRKAKKKGR
jgi:RND family efflux transporter MFP subunit